MASLSTHSRAFLNFQKRLFNSRFFTISLLLHALLVILFGGTVLFQKFVEPPDFEASGSEFVDVGTAGQAPKPPDPLQNLPTPTVPTVVTPPVPAAASLSAITTTSLVP